MATLSMQSLFATLSIITIYIECQYGECCYAWRRIYNILMLSVVMLNFVVLSVIMLSVIVLSVAAQ